MKTKYQIGWVLLFQASVFLSGCAAKLPILNPAGVKSVADSIVLLKHELPAEYVYAYSNPNGAPDIKNAVINNAKKNIQVTFFSVRKFDKLNSPANLPARLQEGLAGRNVRSGAMMIGGKSVNVRHVEMGTDKPIAAIVIEAPQSDHTDFAMITQYDPAGKKIDEDAQTFLENISAFL